MEETGSAFRNAKRDGMNYFRSTEYYSLRGEFFRFRDAKEYSKAKGQRGCKGCQR